MSGPADPRRARPVFVERQTYRRRRLADAARALPVLGLGLWMVPLLWGEPPDAPRSSRALIYLFAVWAGLVAGTALLVALLGRGAPDPEDEAGDAP